VTAVELTIEKLVYGGDGLARLPPSNGAQRATAVFVPYVLPGERVEVGVVEERPGFIRARLDNVLQASELRTEPPCPYFIRCGGCHYQHTSYEQQLRLKSEILRETLLRVAKLDLEIDIQSHPSAPLHYRNRTRFHLHTHPEFAMGYFRHGSHQLLRVHECPISSPLINRALAQLWREGESGRVPKEIAEIELFADASDERLMLELYINTESSSRNALVQFASDIRESIPELQAVASFHRASSRSGVAEQTHPDVLHGAGSMTYQVGAERYQVSAGAFFQTNRTLVPRMVELALGERKGRLALDLYSGVGLFALPLARRFDRVVAVESAPVSADDLRANVPSNVKVSAQSSEAYLTSVADSLRPDLIIADPPRAGLGPSVCAQVVKLRPNEVVYISCDPATLARDLKQLTSSGLSITEMHLIDLFPQTFHIESITVLRRA
jgi:23S rRNA (uracil1939-C5)-methyltransferase